MWKSNKISIHAPLRGATITVPVLVLFVYISIHAPLRGATHLLYSELYTQSNFNPRSPAGSDPVRQKRRSRRSISIHAPLRGATCQVRIHQHGIGFQSTLPCGERRPRRGSPPTPADFNPRSPAGRAHIRQTPRFPSGNFNPRSPAGSDPFHFLSSCRCVLFQSTLPCGERQRQKSRLHFPYDFNPRSPAGSDPGCHCVCDGIDISIHAPLRGATKVKHSDMLIN